MAFKDKAGTAITTSGGTAIDSGHTSTFTSDMLFDGNDSTFWDSASDTSVLWAGYQFASVQAVMQVGLQKHATMNGDVVAIGVWLEFSNDGIVWYPVGTLSPSVGLVSNDTMVYFAPPLNTSFDTGRTGFGSHSYWRVLGSEDGYRNTFAAYSAMAFKDGSGSTIAATGGTAIESAHFSTFAVANLFDGSDSTFWESGSSTVPWCGYQFASPQAVMQIGLQKHATMDGSFPASLGTFQFSDDGITWVTAGVAEVRDRITVNDSMTYFNLTGSL